MTWADLSIGVPSLLVCVEMVPLSLLLHYAYSFRPYVLGSDLELHAVVGDGSGDDSHRPQSYQGGALGMRALLEVWNPREVIEAVAFGFRMEAERRGYIS